MPEQPFFFDNRKEGSQVSCLAFQKSIRAHYDPILNVRMSQVISLSCKELKELCWVYMYSSFIQSLVMQDVQPTQLG